MPDVRLPSVDNALRELERLQTGLSPSAGRPPVLSQRASKKAKRTPWRWWAWLLLVVLAAGLPFVALVRLAVFLYASYGMPTWVALGLAAFGVTALLTAYAALLSYRLSGRWRLSWTSRVAGLLVAVYCGYALAYVSVANVKTSEVQATYTALHPLLRLATSTLILADGGLVITDTAREAADYARMGLPVRQRSLHYRQADGWSHAIDLRTSGRAAWQNAWIETYFEAMGFQTLRHVGTADHLHVALPVQ